MKHKPTKRWEIIKVQNDKSVRQKPNCPRCGEGIYMALHKEKTGKTRQYCGKCHYTIWP
ncbi:MAG: ribosomal S27a family protein [Candidatus Aenigmatarchaeota archaeon]|nr:30S ribosomal protein S27ae [Candidatus Aenigmarchaeota archaeon]